MIVDDGWIHSHAVDIDHRSRFVLSIEFFLFIVDDGWIHHLRLILVVDHCSDLGWLFV